MSKSKSRSKIDSKNKSKNTCGFPMDSLWVPYGFPMDSLWFYLGPIFGSILDLKNMSKTPLSQKSERKKERKKERFQFQRQILWNLIGA